MSDWMILVSFLAIEAWLLVVTIYVAKNVKRPRGDAGAPGPEGPPGPAGPMGMAGKDADESVLQAHEFRIGALERDDGPHSGDFARLEARIYALESLIWAPGSKSVLEVEIPKGSLNLPVPPQE